MWQGSTFGININIQDSSGNTQNLTGYSARMQMRSSYTSASATETLTTANGEISIDAQTGNVAIQLAAERTANIAVDMNNGKPPKSMYVYDLELVDASNNVSKLLYGDVTVYGEVTR